MFRYELCGDENRKHYTTVKATLVDAGAVERIFDHEGGFQSPALPGFIYLMAVTQCCLEAFQRQFVEDDLLEQNK